MRTIEASGKSVDEAIFNGLRELSISIDEVEIEIIQTETKGVLGIGAKPARVRLIEREADFFAADYAKETREGDRDRETLPRQPREGQPPKRREERPREERPREQQRPREDRPQEQRPREERSREARRETAESGGMRRNESGGMRRSDSGEVRRSDSGEARRNESGEARRNDSGNRRRRDRGGRRRSFEEGTAVPESIRRPRVEYTAEAASSLPAAEFVKGIMEKMGAEANVLAAVENEAIYLRIDSPAIGVIIGHRGETLDALQYLTSLVANKNRKEQGYLRVTLDTEGYREKREETLSRLARRIAGQVKASDQPRALEPMNPSERRVLHATLQNNPYVTTYSEGEEPNRHVVIAPKRKGESGQARGNEDGQARGSQGD